jgi:hypothetical protein
LAKKLKIAGLSPTPLFARNSVRLSTGSQSSGSAFLDARPPLQKQFFLFYISLFV